MKDKSQVFQLLGETSASIFPLAQAVMGPLFAEYFDEQRFYQPIFMAYRRAPEPISPALFLKRTPYANPQGVDELLTGAADAGYLQANGAGGFLIAERGSAAIEAVHHAFYSHIEGVNRFPAGKLSELSSLLAKLVASVGKSELDEGKLCFDLTHGGHIQVEAGTLAKVDQQLDDLIAFRDDAHIAAWRPLEADGQVWEVLTFVWNGEANTAEKLVERLVYRQFTAEDYQAALDKLAQRGWIKEGPDGYLITGEGKKIRDQGEADTDAIFFKPWRVLSDAEIGRLGELLAGLKEINLKLAAELNGD